MCSQSNKKTPYLVAITGASGSIYGLRLIGHLLQLGFPVDLIISKDGEDVIKHELNIKSDKESIFTYLSNEKFFNINKDNLILLENNNFFSKPASGSSDYKTMIIAPCSMKTLSSIANGFSDSLINRAGDTMLKENKTLVLVPRETPLSAIHLENMQKALKAGARMIPAMPAFYKNPKTIEELVDFLIGKIFLNLKIDSDINPVWQG